MYPSGHSKVITPPHHDRTNESFPGYKSVEYSPRTQPAKALAGLFTFFARIQKSPEPMTVEQLSPRLETLVSDTRALLEQAVREHQDVVYSNSLGAEAMVMTDIICT